MARSTFYDNTSHYFDSTENYRSDALSSEIAVLQRRILLPILPREKVCEKVLKAYSNLNLVYHTAEELYTDMVGNFYLSMLFPLVQDGKSTELHFSAPKVTNIKNKKSTLKTKGYYERNYINLLIPKLIVLNFRKEIPAGTKFVANFIGGSSNIDSIQISAVSEIGEFQMLQEEQMDTTGLTQREIVELVRENTEAAQLEYIEALEQEEKQYGDH